MKIFAFKIKQIKSSCIISRGVWILDDPDMRQGKHNKKIILKSYTVCMFLSLISLLSLANLTFTHTLTDFKFNSIITTLTHCHVDSLTNTLTD